MNHLGCIMFMCVDNKDVTKCLPSGNTSNPYTSTINVNTVYSRCNATQGLSFLWQ